MSYVIVDIDGTIALKGDRDPFHYHLANQDRPNWPVITTVQALHDAGHRIVFFSGRENVDFETNDDYKAHGRTGTCHELTIEWIKRYLRVGNLHVDDIDLYMRAEGDHRKDAVVKRELFDTHMAGKDILCAIDDRDQVVRMWRDELGLTCLQVADGDF